MSSSGTAPWATFSSLDASICGALPHAAARADDRLTAQTRLDPQRAGCSGMGRAGDVAAGAGRGVAGAFRPRDQPHLTGSRCRLMASATQPSDPHGSIALRIRGGVDAQSRARRWVRSQLDTNLAQTTASDVALAVSELVTNNPDRVGGMGLFIVNELSEAWGVARDGTEATCVWCDIRVHQTQSSQPRVVDSGSASLAPS
jgi:hypothetical protein